MEEGVLGGVRQHCLGLPPAQRLFACDFPARVDGP